MILIVESGSTKADWVLLDGVNIISSFNTKGWNPLFLTSEQMMLRLKSYRELKAIFTKITEVHFYTPGCSSSSSLTSHRYRLQISSAICSSDLNMSRTPHPVVVTVRSNVGIWAFFILDLRSVDKIIKLA